MPMDAVSALGVENDIKIRTLSKVTVGKAGIIIWDGISYHHTTPLNVSHRSETVLHRCAAESTHPFGSHPDLHLSTGQRMPRD